jgi:hypothetical protein
MKTLKLTVRTSPITEPACPYGCADFADVGSMCSDCAEYGPAPEVIGYTAKLLRDGREVAVAERGGLRGRQRAVEAVLRGYGCERADILSPWTRKGRQVRGQAEHLDTTGLVAAVDVFVD